MPLPIDTNGYLRKIRKHNGCWLWRGYKNKDGYGVLFAGGRSWKAHRFYYTKFASEIPKNLTIDHLCRVRHCVNPKHLERVSHQTNVSRGLNGIANNPNCKHGHPYSESNTYYVIQRGRQRRRCRICGLIATKKYIKKKRLNAS